MTTIPMQSVLGNIGTANNTLPPSYGDFYNKPQMGLVGGNNNIFAASNTLPPTPQCTLPPTGDWNF